MGGEMKEDKLLSILNAVFSLFLKDCNWKETKIRYNEAHKQIVARLRAFDKLKKEIEKLCQRLSGGVDK